MTPLEHRQRRACPRALPYGAVALAAISWGTWGLIVRRTQAIGTMPAALESAIVMGVVTLVCGAASLCDRVRRRRTLKEWGCVAWFGASDLLNILLFFAAYKLTIAAAVLTHYLTPVFVALTAPLVLKEKITARTGFAIGASFAGLAAMLASGHGRAGSGAMWLSAALGTGSAVFYASNVLVNKIIAEAFSTSQAMFWHGAAATLLGLALVPPAAWATVDPHAAAFLAVASVGPGALGGLAFIWGLRRMPAAHASTLTLLEPLVSLLLGAAVLSERLGIPAMLGGALILGGALAVMTQAPAVASPVRPSASD